MYKRQLDSGTTCVWRCTFSGPDESEEIQFRRVRPQSSCREYRKKNHIAGSRPDAQRSSIASMSTDQPLREALIELTNKRCGCLLVTDEKEELQGIFTDGDLRRAIQSSTPGILEKSIQDLMTSNFFSISENVLVTEALSIMQQNPSRRVMVMPILDSKKLVGLLHMHDIVQAGIS